MASYVGMKIILNTVKFNPSDLKYEFTYDQFLREILVSCKLPFLQASGKVCIYNFAAKIAFYLG